MSRRPGIVLAFALALAGVLVAACGSTPSGSPSPGLPSSDLPSSGLPSSAPAGTGAASASASASSPASSSGAVVVTPSPKPTPKATPKATPKPAAPFRLASTAFPRGGSIPAVYTCDGADTSPALSWSGVPTQARVLVLTVTDPDASGFAHWIAVDIDPGAGHLARGAGAAGSSLLQGTNDFGRVGWGGPCPPGGTHRYVFTLYALASPLGLGGHPGISAVSAALAHVKVLGTAKLQGTYRRP